jgi:hypothetical protein
VDREWRGLHSSREGLRCVKVGVAVWYPMRLNSRACCKLLTLPRCTLFSESGVI